MRRTWKLKTIQELVLWVLDILHGKVEDSGYMMKKGLILSMVGWRQERGRDECVVG